jgi:glycosyltransferase involved in cell wall biosynthesis
LVVGDGGEHERLQRLATPLENRITFVGHQTDTWPYYFLADMFVLPSLSEGSPLVILEAMAAGLPIVATTVGGVPELLTDNKTALLTSPADPQALARAMALLLMNPALRQSLGAAAQSASESHTPLRYATALHALYADPL